MNLVTFSKLIVFEMWLHEWDIWNPIVWNEKETNFLLVCLGFAQVSSHMCTQLIPCLYIYAYIVQLLTCASITAYDAANAQFYFHFLPVIFSVEKFTGFILNAHSVCYMYDTKVKLISLSLNLSLQEMPWKENFDINLGIMEKYV